VRDKSNALSSVNFDRIVSVFLAVRTILDNNVTTYSYYAIVRFRNS